MSEPFKPQSLTILDLFTNSDARYQVPSYQRNYKWTNEEIEQLWEDLTESWEDNPEGDYFLGSVIATSQPKQGQKNRYYDIVDGQQRLTTLMILFCVSRDYLSKPKNGANNNKVINIIDDAIKSKHDGLQRLFPGNIAKGAFEDHIIKKGATKNLKQPSKKDIDGNNPGHKFINSAVFFRGKLEDLGRKEAESFITYLFYQVQVIRIDCQDLSFAIKLFQIINDRGLDLSASDLVKSFLLGKISGIHKDDPQMLEGKKDHFINDWTEIENMASNCYTNMDDMLALYQYYILAANPKKGLFEELSKKFEEQFKNGVAPTEILGEIKGFVKTYQTEIFHNNSDKVMFSFWYIRWQMYWRSILLTALHKKYSDFDELAKELRRFYYLYWTAGETLTKIKQTSFTVIKDIKDNKPINEIVEMLRNKIDADKVIEKAIVNLSSNNMGQESWTKAILLLLEYEIKDDSTLGYIEWDNKLHLEHIFPQTPKSGWEHISENIGNQYLNSAGNLTLLSGKKNIGASNDPFAEKIDFYKGKKGTSQGTTSFAITQKIISHHDAGKEWDEKAMRNRKQWFLKAIAKLLDIEKEMAAYNSDS